MAILKSKDGTDFYLDCCCGCDEGIRFRIDKEDHDYYCIMTYTNGQFYREQDDTIWRVIQRKLKKIWAIIRNKDFYYAEIVVNERDFCEFKDYINSL